MLGNVGSELAGYDRFLSVEASRLTYAPKGNCGISLLSALLCLIAGRGAWYDPVSTSPHRQQLR